jgi:hypothetical protein
VKNEIIIENYWIFSENRTSGTAVLILENAIFGIIFE